MKTKKLFLYPLLTILILFASLFLIRFFSERQIDDISPQISCDKELLKKADVFYIIPQFNNQSIAKNKQWCQEILEMNKKLALHGVYHTYKEFKTDKTESYLQEGINSFEECFNKKPTKFKPPQLAISKNNKKLVNQKLDLDLDLNQLFHRVYHCNDTGLYKNKWANIF